MLDKHKPFRCETCFWFDVTRDTAPQGICHRLPPTPGQKHQFAIGPFVSTHDFCGEHKTIRPPIQTNRMYMLRGHDETEPVIIQEFKPSIQKWRAYVPTKAAVVFAHESEIGELVEPPPFPSKEELLAAEIKGDKFAGVDTHHCEHPDLGNISLHWKPTTTRIQVYGTESGRQKHLCSFDFSIREPLPTFEQVKAASAKWIRELIESDANGYNSGIRRYYQLCKDFYNGVPRN